MHPRVHRKWSGDLCLDGCHWVMLYDPGSFVCGCLWDAVWFVLVSVHVGVCR